MEQGELAGYAVHRVSEDTGNRMLILADFLFLPGREAHFAALLLKVLEDALKAGVEPHLHVVLLQESLLRFLEKIWVSEAERYPADLVPERIRSPAAGEAARWHFTISDSDNV